ncbi:hypothetical protein QUB63_23265 [Microcoleus sp. ARI1-B5]|uniref:hypothetical protein n=1 Tax=unclassified Microcoleus TaxID=2642155 RepID=UPI002FD16E98
MLKEEVISQESLVIGHWSLVIGHWSLVIGHWSLVIGHWSSGRLKKEFFARVAVIKNFLTVLGVAIFYLLLRQKSPFLVGILGK